MDAATTVLPRRRRASATPAAAEVTDGSPPWRRLVAGAAVCGVVGFGLAWAVDGLMHAGNSGKPAPTAASAHSAGGRR